MRIAGPANALSAASRTSQKRRRGRSSLRAPAVTPKDVTSRVWGIGRRARSAAATAADQPVADTKYGEDRGAGADHRAGSGEEPSQGRLGGDGHEEGGGGTVAQMLEH